MACLTRRQHATNVKSIFCHQPMSTSLQTDTRNLPSRSAALSFTWAISSPSTWQEEILDHFTFPDCLLLCRNISSEFYFLFFFEVDLLGEVNGKQMYYDSVSKFGCGADSQGCR